MRRDRMAALVCAALPTAIAAVLVLTDLTTRPIWLDEGDTFTTASQHGASLWHWAANDGGNMFGYYLLMHLVVAAFGASTLALRLPSALAAIATVLLTFLLCRRLFDLCTATVASVLVAFSLPLVFWGQNARAYSLGVMLAVGSVYAFTVFLDKRSSVSATLYVVVTLLMLYFVLLTATVVVAELVSLAALPRGDVPWRKVAAAVGLTAIASVPLAVMAASRGSAPVSWVATPTLGLYREFFYFLTSAEVDLSQPSASTAHLVALVVLATWVASLVVIGRTLLRARRSRESWAYVLVLCWLVVPVASIVVTTALVHPLLVQRYVLFVLPATAVLSAIALARLRPLPVLLVATAALSFLRAGPIHRAYGTVIDSWRGAVAVVAAHDRPGDCIAFFLDDGYTGFDYYALRLPHPDAALPRPVDPPTTWEARTPHVLDDSILSTSAWKGAVASCPRLWLVTTHANGLAPGGPAFHESKYLQLTALYAEIDGSYTKSASWPGPGHRRIIGVGLTLYDRDRS